MKSPRKAHVQMDTEIAESPSAARTSIPSVPAPQFAFGVMNRVRARLQAKVRGRDPVIELIVLALLADGHVLLEDYPGSGKTTLAKALGAAIVDDKPDDLIVTFRRIQ